MRPIFLVPVLLGALASPILAQNSVSSVAALASQARGNVGGTLEVSGTIQGLFSRPNSANASFLLALPDGQLTLEAAPGMSDSPLFRAGSRVRVLCKIEGIFGDEVLLHPLGFSASVPAPAVETTVFDDVAPTPMVVRPANDFGIRIMTNEANVPVVPRRRATPARRAPSRGVLGSRAMTRPREFAVPDGGSAQSARFEMLARRYNPRLSVNDALYIADSLVEAAATHGIDARFLAAIVQVESAFNPFAVSGAGARGLGQLMPFNLSPLGVGNAFDPRQNLHGAARLLRINLNTYARDPNSTMLAVAAYHAGVGAVNRAGKAIPKASTNRYVWKVYYAYKALAPELFR